MHDYKYLDDRDQEQGQEELEKGQRTWSDR